MAEAVSPPLPSPWHHLAVRRLPLVRFYTTEPEPDDLEQAIVFLVSVIGAWIGFGTLIWLAHIFGLAEGPSRFVFYAVIIIPFGLLVTLSLMALVFAIISPAGLLIWWIVTAARRIRYAMLMRQRGWPPCALSPRLLAFPDAIWRRLPIREEIELTGWCDSWLGGEVEPVNLFATLALLEEAAFAGPLLEYQCAEYRLEKLIRRITLKRWRVS